MGLLHYFIFSSSTLSEMHQLVYRVISYTIPRTAVSVVQWILLAIVFWYYCGLYSWLSRLCCADFNYKIGNLILICFQFGSVSTIADFILFLLNSISLIHLVMVSFDSDPDIPEIIIRLLFSLLWKIIYCLKITHVKITDL